jgi:hypothetical protein
MTSADIYADKNLNAKGVSKTTIKRILNNEGLIARRPHKFHKINEKNI